MIKHLKEPQIRYKYFLEFERKISPKVFSLSTTNYQMTVFVISRTGGQAAGHQGTPGSLLYFHLNLAVTYVTVTCPCTVQLLTPSR